jgi:hypothetical protein
MSQGTKDMLFIGMLIAFPFVVIFVHKIYQLFKHPKK